MVNEQKLNPQEIAKKLLDPKAYEDEQKLKAEAAAREQNEELKKKVAAKQKPKQYYEVKVECLLPAVLTYKVLAEDANQAADLIKGKAPNSIQHRLVGRKELVLKVYDAGSNMMRFMKKLLG